jgi:malto-oligosyltrehalose trehalohydrolase
MHVPDPASRFQPLDVHGPSEVIDPAEYEWNDADWRGRPWEECVVYELHVGAFTPEGTFRAAIGRLDFLRDLGVSAVELMPIADFPGRWNWGYDGVLLFAPDSSYGRPEDLKAFIDAAHQRNIAVLLDVVYNHFGPDGHYLPRYSPIFTEKHKTPWGDNRVNRIEPQAVQIELIDPIKCIVDNHFADCFRALAIEVDGGAMKIIGICGART